MTVGIERQGRGWTLAADGLIATVFLVLIQLELWVFGPEVELSTGVTVMAAVVGTVAAGATALRTVATVPAFVLNAAAVFTLVGLGYESDFYQWSNLLLLFTVAEARRAPVAVAALVSSLLGVGAYFIVLPIDNANLAGPLVGLLWTLVWLAGRMAGLRRRQRSLQIDRDVATAVAATNQERLALQQQRAGMARELHDLIGHTVNVMVVHAGAARRAVRNDPEGAERVMATIESTGRDALAELDRVLGVLRSDQDPTRRPEETTGGASRAPTPGLMALPELADQFRAAGLPTEVEITGPAERVPSSLALAVYRIVQESLTNTLKHAGATGACARVSVEDGLVQVEVEDDGAGGDGAPADAGADGGRGDGGRGDSGRDDGVGGPAGWGLQGISERAELHGGTAEFGPQPEGGFLVRCALPLPADRS